MPEINGVDTILNLVGEPKMSVNLDHKVVKAQQRLISVWNNVYIAIIPYCYKCKKPLIWHTAPREDNIMFHCPKCKRIWTMEAKNG